MLWCIAIGSDCNHSGSNFIKIESNRAELNRLQLTQGLTDGGRTNSRYWRLQCLAHAKRLPKRNVYLGGLIKSAILDVVVGAPAVIKWRPFGATRAAKECRRLLVPAVGSGRYYGHWSTMWSTVNGGTHSRSYTAPLQIGNHGVVLLQVA